MSDDEKMSLPFKILFCLFLLGAGIVFGFFATVNKWWVANRINDVRVAFKTVAEDFKTPWYLDMPRFENTIKTFRPDELMPGLILVSGISADERNFIRVINREGDILQEWTPDWFEVWPEFPDGIPPVRAPKKQPGAVLHGTEIAPNGDVVFNFENLSTVRMNACGEVSWKLDNLGHHSVAFAEDDTIYVSSERFYPPGEITPYLNHTSPLNSMAIEQLDQDGNRIMFKEIIEILTENDLLGLLHMSTLANTWTNVGGDTMHLNDIDVYPSDMPSEIFAPGDLMVSLRNINTVLVVDPKTWKVKFRSTGAVLRQHDPEFAPDDKILVFDNRNLNPLAAIPERYSRIVEIDARTGAAEVAFEGTGETHFYTPAMGKHQPLPNGNNLITSTQQGRAIEVSAAGDLVWEFNNVVSEENNGVVMEAQVLPLEMDATFFQQARATCTN